ncbi:hypothetical protein DER44DRAFT_468247 [Fusarium oxysporum]|nr:hypothetical protein DER44DRAFT_468247 [Fusarium oxysporum]
MKKMTMQDKLAMRLNLLKSLVTLCLLGFLGEMDTMQWSPRGLHRSRLIIWGFSRLSSLDTQHVDSITKSFPQHLDLVSGVESSEV